MIACSNTRVTSQAMLSALSKQPVSLSADALKNERYACSLEFLSVFPETPAPHMKTH